MNTSGLGELPRTYEYSHKGREARSLTEREMLIACAIHSGAPVKAIKKKYGTGSVENVVNKLSLEAVR